MRLPFGLLRQPNPLLEDARPAALVELTAEFMRFRRTRILVRASIAFVVILVLALGAQASGNETLGVLSVLLNLVLLAFLLLHAVRYLRYSNDHATLRFNPWAQCEGEVRLWTAGLVPLCALVEVKRLDWERSVVVPITKTWASALVNPSKEMLVAGEPGQSMAFAPFDGAPACFSIRFIPKRLIASAWAKSAAMSADPEPPAPAAANAKETP